MLYAALKGSDSNELAGRLGCISGMETDVSPGFFELESPH